MTSLCPTGMRPTARLAQTRERPSHAHRTVAATLMVDTTLPPRPSANVPAGQATAVWVTAAPYEEVLVAEVHRLPRERLGSARGG